MSVTDVSGDIILTDPEEMMMFKSFTDGARCATCTCDLGWLLGRVADRGTTVSARTAREEGLVDPQGDCPGCGSSRGPVTANDGVLRCHACGQERGTSPARRATTRPTAAPAAAPSPTIHMHRS